MRTTAAERTWDRITNEFNRLPQHAELTVALLVAVIEMRTTAITRSWLEACKVFNRLARHAGLEEVEKRDPLRGHHEPGERVLPSDADLLPLLHQLRRPAPWGWAIAAIAAYGFSPPEVLTLQPRDDGTMSVLTIKRKSCLPMRRTTFSLPQSWVQELDLTAKSLRVSFTWRKPGDYDSAEAKRQVQKMQMWLVRPRAIFVGCTTCAMAGQSAASERG